MGQADDTEVAAVVAALRAGEVVLLPTDTVYGVAALPSVAGATTRFFEAKDRSEGQPLAVRVGESEQAFADQSCHVRSPASFWAAVRGSRRDVRGAAQSGTPVPGLLCQLFRGTIMVEAIKRASSQHACCTET